MANILEIQWVYVFMHLQVSVCRYSYMLIYTVLLKAPMGVWRLGLAFRLQGACPTYTAM